MLRQFIISIKLQRKHPWEEEGGSKENIFFLIKWGFCIFVVFFLLTNVHVCYLQLCKSLISFY